MAQITLNSSGVASNGTLKLQSNGTTDAVTIDTSQNIGIGTSTINNAVTTYRGAGVSNYIQFTNATTGTASTDGCLIGVAADDTSLRLRVLEAASMIFSTSDTERMRLNSSGNLGLGTTSPESNGGYSAMTISNTDGGQTYWKSTGSSVTAYAGADAVGAYLATLTNHALIFRTNNTERARIDSSGNLLVGTTSQIAAGRVGVSYNGSTLQGIALNDTAGSSSAQPLRFLSNGTAVGTITTSTTNTAYNTSSDYRLKNTVEPMVGALAKVVALKPCTYKWNINGSSGEGFIAHELAEVCPQAVHGEKDAVDENGNPVYQGIDTSFLVATLTAAIQEQQAIITALTARIEALEA